MTHFERSDLERSDWSKEDCKLEIAFHCITLDSSSFLDDTMRRMEGAENAELSSRSHVSSSTSAGSSLRFEIFKRSPFSPDFSSRRYDFGEFSSLSLFPLLSLATTDDTFDVSETSR